MSFLLDAIIAALESESSVNEPQGHAAVTLILRDKLKPASPVHQLVDYEVLMIERADNPNDPWSGQMAFPGGRHENQDKTILDTAYRETVEEIGVDLYKDGRFLGCLQDLQARNRHGVQKFKVAPHLFALKNEVEFSCQPTEVKRTHWVPFSHLLEQKNHQLMRYPFAENSIDLPSISFAGKPIWGLSYVMLTHFIERLFEREILNDIIEGEISSIDFWQKYTY